jgi:uncharacterized protein
VFNRYRPVHSLAGFALAALGACVVSSVVAQSPGGPSATGPTAARQVVSSLYGAIREGDLTKAASFLDEHADFFITPGMPHQAPFYKGRDAFVQGVWVELKKTHVPDIAAAASETLSGGDQVTVIGRYTGTSRLKRKVDIPFVHSWTVRAGKVTELRVFTDAAQWRAVLVE